MPPAERRRRRLRGRLRRGAARSRPRPVPRAVAGPRGKAGDRRYDVYRNNVTVSLIDALAAVFPATQRITGPEFFRAMARFHVRATPPTSPLLFEYGRDFPDFIAGYEHARAMPWLRGRGADRAGLARRLPRRRRRAAGAGGAGGRPARAAGRSRAGAASGDPHRALALSGGQHLRGEPRRRAGRPHRGDRARRTRWSPGPASRSSSGGFRPAARRSCAARRRPAARRRRPRRRWPTARRSISPPTSPGCSRPARSPPQSRGD